MDWNIIQQLIRIALYNAGALFLGKSVADGDMYQAAIGGVISIVAFGWWLYQQRTGKGVPPIVPVLALVVILPLLGGCKTASEIYAEIKEVIAEVNDDTAKVWTAIQKNCAAISTVAANVESTTVAVGGSCKARDAVAKAQAAISSTCGGSQPSVTNIAAFSIAVANAYKAAKAAEAAGC